MFVQSLDQARFTVNKAAEAYDKNRTESNLAKAARAREAYFTAKRLHDEHMAEHGD